VQRGAQAVAAFTAASRRAGEAGLTVVVIMDGWLIRQNLASTVALEMIAFRIKSWLQIEAGIS
jgi:hypothetical protein